MPLIPFPNVPAVSGVPALPRIAGASGQAQAALGILQGALWKAASGQKQWGIFDSKGKALGSTGALSTAASITKSVLGFGSTQSTVSVDYLKESKVSDFPVEKGGFASYNKVEMPAAPIVTLCFSGSETEAGAFLTAIDAACKSTDLFSVVTPEAKYIDHAIERYNYQRRHDKGASILVVEIMLKEVRTVSAQYTKAPDKKQINDPKSAGAAPAVDAGKVQPAAPEKSLIKSAAEKLGF
jgi:hypothetical protein